MEWVNCVCIRLIGLELHSPPLDDHAHQPIHPESVSLRPVIPDGLSSGLKFSEGLSLRVEGVFLLLVLDVSLDLIVIIILRTGSLGLSLAAALALGGLLAGSLFGVVVRGRFSWVMSVTMRFGGPDLGKGEESSSEYALVARSHAGLEAREMGKVCIVWIQITFLTLAGSRGLLAAGRSSGSLGTASIDAGSHQLLLCDGPLVAGDLGGVVVGIAGNALPVGLSEHDRLAK